ncbi:Parathion hydrolase precursor [Polystyrenella longa]|uniref:Parathion hydrolase n=1 Tax=Polystyrenella longa TaxID=2528007 RepID=A0A518CRH9_9PLAN|nr:hypothetical protein [Polystyrenella longa]QDU81829.1 Parathion hydrolase precursor [Polystyrenella longa]
MPYDSRTANNSLRNSRRDCLKKLALSGAGAALLPTAFVAQSLKARAATPAKNTQTVLGPVPVDQLGMTLMHEHAPSVDWSELYEQKPGPLAEIREEMLTNTAGLLDAFHKTLNEKTGPGAIVECTPIRVGRYPLLMKELAERTPVHIIASTGFWCEAAAPQHPWAIELGYSQDGVRKLADLFVREISEGMEDPSGEFGEKFTNIKAGMIKIATSNYLRPSERRVHEAAAIAAIETGAPVTTHTTSGGGLEEAELFLRMKADPSKICIGHLGNKDDRENENAYEYHRHLAELGFNVQFDRVGLSKYKPEKSAVQIHKLIDCGHANQILVSHDAVPYVYTNYATDEVSSEGWSYDPVDFTQCSTVLVDELKKLDVSDETLYQIMVKNPQRVLGFC